MHQPLRRFLAYVTDDDKTPNKMREARRRVYDPAAQQQQQQQAGPCARAVSSPYCGEFLFVIASLSCIVLLFPHSQYFSNYFFFIPFIILALLSPSLPPSSNSDPGSQSGRSSPLPTTVRAFLFIARNIQHFLPSSTRVEWYLPTLLRALSS